jgi:hypothetical protein
MTAAVTGDGGAADPRIRKPIDIPIRKQIPAMT